ncbi:cupin domain-containing protein [Chitinophaga polysaccharea]|uniref:cupin domain-containing protein n=1 Tax=Chitinophaga TaxID=79328 RepID=UPI001455346E|nr:MULTISPECIES: cupin domain-containing protein [Chitinophaga]NLR59771.1 cupin domain-containing protein [Chitinophaga polysaccharea]NLU94124.1 cupin domain-containing protein [Chitinophaga sp. Ak27]
MKGINVMQESGNEKVKSCAILKTQRFDATLLIVQQGYQIPPHTSPANAMILILEGKIAFMLNEEVTILETGDVFSFGANELHALQALETTRFILIK